jgi:hypothetical protein
MTKLQTGRTERCYSRRVIDSSKYYRMESIIKMKLPIEAREERGKNDDGCLAFSWCLLCPWEIHQAALSYIFPQSCPINILALACTTVPQPSLAGPIWCSIAFLTFKVCNQEATKGSTVGPTKMHACSPSTNKCINGLAWLRIWWSHCAFGIFCFRARRIVTLDPSVVAVCAVHSCNNRETVDSPSSVFASGRWTGRFGSTFCCGNGIE